jgi:hypothetical protein
MVIVLVPTGTPFLADRRMAAERRHFDHANHSGTANDSTAESLGLSLPPMAPLLIVALDALDHAALPLRRPGADSPP